MSLVSQEFAADVQLFDKGPDGSLDSTLPSMSGRLFRRGDDWWGNGTALLATGTQRIIVNMEQRRATFQVFNTQQLFDDEEAELDAEDKAADTDDPVSVGCVKPEDGMPAVASVRDALDTVEPIDEAGMLEVVGRGGCSGDDVGQRWIISVGDVPIVLCRLAGGYNLQAVSIEFVACACDALLFTARVCGHARRLTNCPCHVPDINIEFHAPQSSRHEPDALPAVAVDPDMQVPDVRLCPDLQSTVSQRRRLSGTSCTVCDGQSASLPAPDHCCTYTESPTFSQRLWFVSGSRWVSKYGETMSVEETGMYRCQAGNGQVNQCAKDFYDVDEATCQAAQTAACYFKSSGSQYQCYQGSSSSKGLGKCRKDHPSQTGVASCECDFDVKCLRASGCNKRLLQSEGRTPPSRNLKGKDDDPADDKKDKQDNDDKDKKQDKCKLNGRRQTRRCVFVHGAGVRSPAGGKFKLREDYRWYWGPVKKQYVPHVQATVRRGGQPSQSFALVAASVKGACTSVEFLHLDTATRPWDDPALAEEFCSVRTSPCSLSRTRPRAVHPLGVTLALSAGSVGMQALAPGFPSGLGSVRIDDTVVFAHGIGNLIVANAKLLQMCKLGTSSYWLEINVRGRTAARVCIVCLTRTTCAPALYCCAQDGKPLSRLAKWNLEFCDEAARFKDAAAIDSQLDYAYTKRQGFRDPNGDDSNDWGGKKNERKANKKAWRQWRRKWLRETLTPSERRALRRRQNQRRVVRDTGACAMDADPALVSRLARFSFTQSPAWQYLSVVSGSDHPCVGMRVRVARRVSRT